MAAAGGPASASRRATSEVSSGSGCTSYFICSVVNSPAPSGSPRSSLGSICSGQSKTRRRSVLAPSNRGRNSTRRNVSNDSLGRGSAPRVPYSAQHGIQQLHDNDVAKPFDPHSVRDFQEDENCKMSHKIIDHDTGTWSCDSSEGSCQGWQLEGNSTDSWIQADSFFNTPCRSSSILSPFPESQCDGPEEIAASIPFEGVEVPHVVTPADTEQQVLADPQKVSIINISLRLLSTECGGNGVSDQNGNEQQPHGITEHNPTAEDADRELEKHRYMQLLERQELGRQLRAQAAKQMEKRGWRCRRGCSHMEMHEVATKNNKDIKSLICLVKMQENRRVQRTYKWVQRSEQQTQTATKSKGATK